MIEVPWWVPPVLMVLGAAACEVGRWAARNEDRLKRKCRKLGVKRKLKVEVR